MSLLLEYKKYNELLTRANNAMKFLDNTAYSWAVKEAELPKFYNIAADMDICLDNIQCYTKKEIRHGFKIKEV